MTVSLYMFVDTLQGERQEAFHTIGLVQGGGGAELFNTVRSKHFTAQLQCEGYNVAVKCEHRGGSTRSVTSISSCGLIQALSPLLLSAAGSSRL